MKSPRAGPGVGTVGWSWEARAEGKARGPLQLWGRGAL